MLCQRPDSLGVNSTGCLSLYLARAFKILYVLLGDLRNLFWLVEAVCSPKDRQQQALIAVRDDR